MKRTNSRSLEDCLGAQQIKHGGAGSRKAPRGG